MTPTIDTQTKTGITDFLPTFQAAITSLKALASKSGVLADEINKNGSQDAALSEIESPNDQEIISLLVTRERSAILTENSTKTANQETEERGQVAGLAQQAAELVRGAIGKQMFAKQEADLVESLPVSIRADQNLLFRLTGESAGKRSIARFFNSPTLSKRDDSETILAEAERLAQLLDDISNFRDIPLPNELSATVTDGQ